MPMYINFKKLIDRKTLYLVDRVDLLGLDVQLEGEKGLESGRGLAAGRPEATPAHAQRHRLEYEI